MKQQGSLHNPVTHVDKHVSWLCGDACCGGHSLLTHTTDSCKLDVGTPLANVVNVLVRRDCLRSANRSANMFIYTYCEMKHAAYYAPRANAVIELRKNELILGKKTNHKYNTGYNINPCPDRPGYIRF